MVAGPLPAPSGAQLTHGLSRARDGLGLRPAGGGPDPRGASKRPPRGLPRGHQEHHTAGVHAVHHTLSAVVGSGVPAGLPSASPVA